MLLVRIPRSYNPPHRVIRQGKGQHRFWARSSAGKYEPNVDELRELFVLAPRLADRIREFRIDRVAKIAAGEAPVSLMDGGCIIIHAIPFSAFDVRSSLDIKPMIQAVDRFPPLGSRSPTMHRINFDGVLMLSNADDAARQQRAYVQVFRNGMVEAVASSLLNSNREKVGLIINSMTVDGYIIQYTMNYLGALEALGMEPPYALLVSLLGVKAARFNFDISQYSSAWYDHLGIALERDQYHFGEIIIEAIPKSRQECATIVRPLLNQIANASGVAATPSIDASGRLLLWANR